MSVNFIDLGAQYRAYKDEIDTSIHEVLDTSHYIMGQKLSDFETNLATFSGAKHAIGCSSGTSALILALLALDIKAGDEVITTPFTFIATAEMIAFMGAKPVFVDIDERTYNINASKIEEKITTRTKAIMPVSLFGQCADMDEIAKIASKHGIAVIEDGAQSFGALYKGKRSCNLSVIGCTSFFPAKPLGCYGDGGAVFTSDDELAKKMRILLNHGQTERYVHKYIGFNGRLDAIQAAVLDVKLKYFNAELAKRQIIAKNYNEKLENVITPFIENGNESAWAQYCIRVKNRQKVLEICANEGIPTGVYYPIPLHLQEVFAYLGHKKGDFEICEKISEDIMALPMSAFLSPEDQQKVIEVINKATA
ncbi:DegT/DnrJ/EryC1/StrS family aminotransferase [Campylobacter sp.]|uniref:DegT/DnrJ/EryC1/StrS family aminotransferase n=1 Tax=Campylobacter sp. TaxID=205 RepID=UPI002A761A03|nr:DegT/DnrJ/EryC1/StrS family aminotransferase [Campylobacter sp.]MDY2763689.1 DegT/DnrJ/EryC1/StrS family aminotransferase [Campylobacter sp.]